MHSTIWDISHQHTTDQEIYSEIQKQLPSIKPMFADIRYGIPALRKQKIEMARQTAIHLDGIEKIEGYLEIGGAGRYIQPISKVIDIT